MNHNDCIKAGKQLTQTSFTNSHRNSWNLKEKNEKISKMKQTYSINEMINREREKNRRKNTAYWFCVSISFGFWMKKIEEKMMRRA